MTHTECLFYPVIGFCVQSSFSVTPSFPWSSPFFILLNTNTHTHLRKWGHILTYPPLTLTISDIINVLHDKHLSVCDKCYIVRVRGGYVKMWPHFRTTKVHRGRDLFGSSLYSIYGPWYRPIRFPGLTHSLRPVEISAWTTSEIPMTP